jgi:hypothetical protein
MANVRATEGEKGEVGVHQGKRVLLPAASAGRVRPSRVRFAKTTAVPAATSGCPMILRVDKTKQSMTTISQHSIFTGQSMIRPLQE